MASPKNEVDQKRDETLRRMLNTPRKPHAVANEKKKVRAAKKKAARK